MGAQLWPRLRSGGKQYQCNISRAFIHQLHIKIFLASPKRPEDVVALLGQWSGSHQQAGTHQWTPPETRQALWAATVATCLPQLLHSRNNLRTILEKGQEKPHLPMRKERCTRRWVTSAPQGGPPRPDLQILPLLCREGLHTFGKNSFVSLK